ESNRPWALWSAVTGVAAAGAFLTKGLIGLAFPGLIVVAWALLTRRLRPLSTLLLGPALLVFLVVALPSFFLAASRNPGFLQFFFVREHFQRFATAEAHRPGPFYYFAGIFLAGFLPGLSFFFAAFKGRTLSDWIGRDSDSLFLLLWFLVVLLV